MANILAPFGFRWAHQLSGVAPNCAQTMRRILKTNTTAIFHGDPVASQSTGYVQQAAVGTSPVGGIFVGCCYLSISIGRLIWSNYWPGNSDAQSDPECYIVDDPNAVFTVQVNGGPLALSSVGMNANFTLATGGNTASGMSGVALDGTTAATTSTLPFRIVGYPGDGFFPAVGPGSDPTSANNNVFVTFNNQDFKTLTGI